MTRLSAICIALTATLATGCAHYRDLSRGDARYISTSSVIEPRVYRVTDPDDAGAIVMEGDGLTVDFKGATLIGSPDNADADSYTGRGIVIRGKNITLRNANVHGYKVGIYAEDSPGLTIENCDVSRNFRQRLKSTPEREDLADWLYGHENDDNEWLRYGAGMYLLRCPGATVRTCFARNGQNGLCLVNCDDALVANNDFSFMSGWGLAMWRSSRCDVLYNRFDFCIRGYSHGVYSRGQDSTGILVYEQCSHNVFAYNSATHGGDGFFLYAGNETLKKTGRGGCNDNLVYRNDFSFAAANGIEATFSRDNHFVMNTLDGCHHGVWAGYSTDSTFQRNNIRDCTNGISIEHGQRNVIFGNHISGAKRGVHLWWDDDVDLLASRFCKNNNDCPSEENLIESNEFHRCDAGIRIADDSDSHVLTNSFAETEAPVEQVGEVVNLRVHPKPETMTDVRPAASRKWTEESSIAIEPKLDRVRPALMALGVDPSDRAMPLPRLYDGRGMIFVDEWGPYDFRSARVFPSRIAGQTGSATVQVLGPSGEFEVVRVSGEVVCEPRRGAVPGKIRFSPPREGIYPFEASIVVENETLAVSGTLIAATWDVRYFAWTPEQDPREGEDHWQVIVAAAPIAHDQTNRLDFAWGMGGPRDDLPRDRFATRATTSLDFPAGKWRIETVSDDGVRVFLDDELVLANWTWHAPTKDEAIVELAAGTHEIRVEHFEIDGYAQLSLRIEPHGMARNVE